MELIVKNECESLEIIAERVSCLLDKNRYVVYVDDSFAWKEAAVSYLGSRHDVEIVTDKAMIELYYLYEFSDRFIVLSESEQYGSVWNYVKGGLITFEDAMDALFS